jgi:hypothetical protein
MSVLLVRLLKYKQWNLWELIISYKALFFVHTNKVKYVLHFPVSLSKFGKKKNRRGHITLQQKKNSG